MVCGLLHLVVGGCQQLPPSPPFWSCYSSCMTLMVCGLLHDVVGWLAGPSCLARPQSVGSGEKQQQQQQRNKDVTGTDTISLTGWVSCCDVVPSPSTLAFSGRCLPLLGLRAMLPIGARTL
jgi:hypothetical protein